MDFYDAAATFLNETTTTFCCSAKLRFVLLALKVVAHIKPSFPSLLSITCGRGVSCAGQCSAIGDQFCPTGAGTRGTREGVNYDQMFLPGVCSGQLGDCLHNWEDEDEEEDEDTEEVRTRAKSSSATLPSWVTH